MGIKWVRNSDGNYASEVPNKVIEGIKHALLLIKQRKDKKWSCHILSGTIQNVLATYKLVVPNPRKNELGIYKTIRDAKADAEIYLAEYLKINTLV